MRVGGNPPLPSFLLKSRKSSMIEIGEISPKSGGSQNRLQVLGKCKNPKTISWLLEKHGQFNIGPKNIIQQEIEEYLKGNGILFYFKNPVWIDEKRKSFFVDFYLPEYRIMIDIRPLMSSEFFNAVIEKQRRRLLKSLDGYIYLPVDFQDLKSGRLISKIQRRMRERYQSKLD